MTRDDMLRSDVAQRLAAAAQPSDADAVTRLINQYRIDAAVLLHRVAASLVGCTNTACTCSIAAVVYNSLAQEVSEAGR